MEIAAQAGVLAVDGGALVHNVASRANDITSGSVDPMLASLPKNVVAGEEAPKTVELVASTKDVEPKVAELSKAVEKVSLDTPASDSKPTIVPVPATLKKGGDDSDSMYYDEVEIEDMQFDEAK